MTHATIWEVVTVRIDRDRAARISFHIAEADAD
jgi:hypothetical protein